MILPPPPPCFHHYTQNNLILMDMKANCGFTSKQVWIQYGNKTKYKNKMILIYRNCELDVLTLTPKTTVWTSARTAAGSGASRRKQRLSGLSDSGQSVGTVVWQWEGLNPRRVPLCAVCMISPNSGELLRAGVSWEILHLKSFTSWSNKDSHSRYASHRWLGK